MLISSPKIKSHKPKKVGNNNVPKESGKINRRGLTKGVRLVEYQDFLGKGQII